MAIGLASVLLSSCSSPDQPPTPEALAARTEALNIGLAYLEENRLTDAEAAFRQAIELVPSDAAGYANLGIVLLRRGEAEEAEAVLQQARDRSPADPAVRLTLAEVYQQQGDLEAARTEVAEGLNANPEHVPLLYRRAQLHTDDFDAYRTYLHAVLARASANVVPRLDYLQALTDASLPDSALFQLEAIRSQLPPLSEQASALFAETRTHLLEGDVEQAQVQARFFHNLLKSTPYYQTGLRLLGIRGDALAGTPLITAPAITQRGDGDADIIDDIQLVRATEPSRIGDVEIPEGYQLTAMATADVNGDTELDVVLAYADTTTGQGALHLLTSQFGRFAEAALPIAYDGSPIRDVSLADYDNDTLLDLFVLTDGAPRLWRNTGEGALVEVSEAAISDGLTAGTVARWADYDHDGDLDVFIGRDGPDYLLRNNGDGTFEERAGAMGFTTTADTRDASIGDFDDDGDLDLMVAHADQPSVLYSNERQGRFSARSGAEVEAIARPAVSVAAGDYNNDGALDLALATANGVVLARNETGHFVAEDELPANNGSVAALQFIEIDNDGLLDLALAGEAVQLWHQSAPGRFADRSGLVADLPTEATTLHIADYNHDRDLDLLLTTSAGPELLRNDGGNQNQALTVQPRGLITGSSKNNYYGIGAKVEVRAGDLYQSRVVTDPIVHIGLGQRTRADVIRIVFSNGVPQNIFQPGADQDIIEEQILKGSCPYLYVWNGEEYVFATDILWRSALGMPLGIQGSDQVYAPAVSAQDYVRVPEAMLARDDDQYKLMLTAELWETPYFDEVALIALDHPGSVEVFVDERFGAVPTSPVPVFPVREPLPVVQAVDGAGVEVTQALQQRDSVFVATMTPSAHQGEMQVHDLVLNPGVLDAAPAALYLHGWVFPTDASINVALSQSAQSERVAPRVQVKNAAGQWETIIPNMGFPMGKNKTIRIDLAERFLTDDYRVRIQTSMQLYWDYAFFSSELPDVPVRRTALSVQQADLAYRGFSQVYRTSPYGPHLVDSRIVSTEPRWRDLEGFYTRYGDVTELLHATDDQYVIMNAGDAITLSFDAEAVPELPEGWQRTFVLYSDGWLKDGDLQTAHGHTVAPLPFQGMSAYPYPSSEQYPMTPANRAYLDAYNTRYVTAQPLRDALRVATETP
ncbi:MAG: FG-GAP-like repeat-containing protein [Rhodothermales bacterium]